jgi:hypothetical protein
MSDDDGVLSVEQAYEAAYRYVMQYLAREPGSESLQLMAVAMQPTPHDKSNDPASWPDFLDCVRRTREQEPLPSIGQVVKSGTGDDPSVLGK